MKKLIVSCSLFCICLCIQAQKKWTLRECVDYAVENNIELRQQALNVKSSEINLSTSKNDRLPNLNAGVGQSFSFGQSQDYNTGTYQSNNAAGTDFRIGTSVPVFTGFKIPNQIKVDELNLHAATEGLRKAKENLELQVVSLYLDVLFKKEILKAYQEQADLSKLQVERTEILVESGKVPSSQLYDIKAQQAKDDLNVTVAVNDLALSLLNLSQSLNLPDASYFDIREPKSEDVVTDNLSSVVPPDQVYKLSLGVKPHVKEAEYKLESSKKNLKVAQSGYWPTLNLELSYSTGYTHVYGKEYADEAEKDRARLSNQLRNNERKYIGFSLSIPIFNRFQTRNQVRSARLNIENQSLALDNVKLALYKEIQQAYQSAVGAHATYISTGKAETAAEISLQYAQERYDIGKSTAFEFSEAKTKLLTNRSERIRAKYDFIFRAKILDFYQGKPIDVE
ncbi:MAG: TolC family protein [Prevotella sp.]|jgi:outer membrane protein|nr:TolC family protein [Prevotella sp.]